jgi:UDP:flavonoid glycosyltransferase YjiC (YdhE family)
MDNVLFLIYPFTGPLTASFLVAKLLTRRGYNIIYIAHPRFREMIEREGYCFDSMFHVAGPTATSAGVGPLKDYLAYLNHAVGEHSPLLTRISEIVGKYRPVAAIVDADIVGAAIALYPKKVPVLLLNTMVSSDKAANVPPFFSSVVPDGSIKSSILIEWIWIRWFVTKKSAYLLRRIFNRGKDDPFQKRLAKICGFPYKRFVNAKRAWMYGLNNYPEFYLYPAELDFPYRRLNPMQHFVGPMIDLTRIEGAFDWNMVRNGNPVVLCALGTLADIYYSRYGEFLERIIDVFRELPHYNLIVAAGKHSGYLASGDLPGNIVVCATVPQLDVLKRAAFIINQGGFKSINECI